MNVWIDLLAIVTIVGASGAHGWWHDRKTRRPLRKSTDFPHPFDALTHPPPAGSAASPPAAGPPAAGPFRTAGQQELYGKPLPKQPYLWNARQKLFMCPKCRAGMTVDEARENGVLLLCECGEHAKDHFHYMCHVCGYRCIMRAVDDVDPINPFANVTPPTLTIYGDRQSDMCTCGHREVMHSLESPYPCQAHEQDPAGLLAAEKCFCSGIAFQRPVPGPGRTRLG